jgi:hypothetical protein
MESPNRYKSSTGMTDLLFNLLVGFVFLFVVAFILINPPTKRNDIPTKAEYLIIIEWNEEFNDDVDLWVQDPNGVKVAFMNKEGGLLNLEKDDLGYSNDTFTRPDGTTDVLRINREVVTMRGTQAGTYSVSAHIYSRSVTRLADGVVTADPGPGTIKFTLIKVNPYKESFIAEYEYTARRQEIPMIEFTLDDQGNIIDIQPLRRSIITGRAIHQSDAAGGSPNTPATNTIRTPTIHGP